MSDQPRENTDRELWREPDKGNGDFYSDSIHVTKEGGIGINVGGHVIVMPLQWWHRLAVADNIRRTTEDGEFPRAITP